MERTYNKLTEEQLTFAQKQREENYLTEHSSISVPIRRDLSQPLKRYFGGFGMTPEEAMARFAETALKEGRVVFDENGFREEGHHDA